MRSVLGFLKPKTEAGLVSVVLRDARIDVVRIQRQTGQRPRVLLAESLEKLADDAAALDAAKRRLKLGTGRCTTLLRHGGYQMIQTDAMPGPVEEAREATRWKLKDQVEFPVESSAIDLLPIPAQGRTPQVFAVLAAEGGVAPLVRAFQAAGLALAVVDVPEMAQRNLAALYEEADRALATLIFDDDEGLLTFTVNGELLAARHVEISSRQLAAADSARRTALFERIELELQRSLDNFERMFSAFSLQHLLMAPIPGVDGLLDHLRSNLVVPVVELDLSAAVDIGAVPALRDPLLQFQCLRALGAALRDEFAA